MITHRPLCPEGQAARRLRRGGPDGLCAEGSRPFVLAATILASAMAFIDGSVVNIALPTIQRDLGAGFAELQWVVNGYILLLGALILVGGGLGDRLGRRRVFVAGIALFALASLACALAPGIEALIAARLLQGVGAALLVPQSLAIIAAAFPKAERGRAIGTWAGASAITTALGPPLGGLLIDALDWRAAFWINLPLSLAAIWLALRHVPESRDESASGRLDWAGGLLAAGACGALTVGLTRLADDGAGGRLPAFGAIALGLAGLWLFLRTERRTAAPLMPTGLFAEPAFLGANVMTLFLYGALGAVLFLLPFDLVGRRGLSAAEVGVTLLPLGLIIGTLSRAAGGLVDRTGPRPPLVLGSALVAVAASGLALGEGGYWTAVFAPILLLALGMALVVSPLTTVVMNAAPDGKSGAASGINNAASRLAGLFAIALVGAAANLIFHEGPAAAGQRFGVLPPPGDALRPAVESAFVSAYSSALWLAALWAALAALVALVMLRPRRPAARAGSGADQASAESGSSVSADSSVA
ncbi:drug resistance transporter, EmrB/QacA subfamily [Tistlia consotensis]|uniref:Drug resistance transporter, EmrB/QacA subfamily n=1 Tax=Tistlia consotensis USBA 355 TaxID=560819 RepID=A0A1Y6BS01_9PROT|nr:MFS transporter [Tistlia consotensis]SMF22348.1 drug resistance transporter, EmrB/QacA subfamily [Tistlia consotensis USBA 355]SNR46065.1 drug resistance transporter, EmrB/QacA subfamily [Tistlia consotensis]